MSETLFVRMPPTNVVIDQPFEIMMRSILSTGHSCCLIHKPDCIVLEGEGTYVQPANNNIPGAPGKMTFTFICLEACNEELQFRYIAPWDAESRFEIKTVYVYPIICQ
jgi:predicted secreted protein